MTIINFISGLTIRAKLVILNTLILGLISGFILIYFPIELNKRTTRAILKNVQAISETCINQLNLVFSSNVKYTFEQAVENIRRNQDVRYIVIHDISGTILGSFNLSDARSLAYQKIHNDKLLKDTIYKVMLPISHNERKVTECYIGISLESFHSELKQGRLTIMTICLIIFFGGMVVVFGISAVVTYHLRSMVKVVERVANGGVHERIVVPFKDEVGQLACSFNSMVMNMESTLQRLKTLTGILDKRDHQLEEEVEQRKFIEQQIKLSYDIINKVSILILVANSTGGIEYASPSFEHVLGYKPENLLGDGWWKASRSDLMERKKERDLIARCARGEHPIKTIPYERLIIDAQGNHRWILWQDTAGPNKTLFQVGQDITERKAAEEQIREQAALLDITGDAIIVRNLDHKILYWNNGAEQLYGWKFEEAVGNQAQQLFQHEGSAEIGIAYTNVIENGEWSGELKQESKDGKKIIVESRWTLMNDKNSKPKSILVVNRDVTEQRQVEAQFRRAQRLENIGTLAGGIAHDLNNVLTPILMSIQALLKRHSDDKTQQLLSTIEMSARRGADIVKQVLTFARGTEGERTLLQPKHILREIEKIVRETFPRSIEIRTNFPSNLWTITGDATQLHQIILNLLVNARDAMPNGGLLSLITENITLDENSTRSYLNAKPGNYVTLSVSDTGTGIKSEILDKIFDPFFTTKEIGKGTGLGLSTVMAIVKSYDGFLTVNSTIGKGTEFKVFIPATHTETLDEKVDKKRRLPTGRGESILFVDDELSIREIMKETLEAYGYRIQTAKDGIEALTLIEKDRHKFRLVLTDMMMPNMDGGSLIRTLRRLAPEIKIIAISGITDPEVLDKIKKSRVEAFLPKPIQTDNLLRILDSVLHSEEKIVT
ncbi:MAG: PAS domain S-box protein [Bacteroidota bacterium]|nr:PAS domain S-box protein [Bacteroidota bacterium]